MTNEEALVLVNLLEAAGKSIGFQAFESCIVFRRRIEEAAKLEHGKNTGPSDAAADPSGDVHS